MHVTLKTGLISLMISFVFAGGILAKEKQLVTKISFPPAEQLPEIKELPDPFLMNNGKRVQTRKDWKTRREEIKTILADYEYGQMPPPPGNVTGEITSKAEHRMEVKLTMGPDKKLIMGLRIWFAKGKGPFPVIVRPKHYSGGMPSESSKRGYMEVRYDNLALDPDERKAVGTAQAAYPDHDWGTIAVWAWAGMRAIDYLVTLPEVDKDKIVVTGHSRGGKTALLLGAFDERVALTVPNASGGGGLQCWRFPIFPDDPKGCKPHEGVHRCRKRTYWFHPRLKPFARKVGHLPFDQHFLVALVAPRALCSTEAMDDQYATPICVQRSILAAKVVYHWLGAGDRIVLHMRRGRHKQGPEDWAALLDFADLVFFGKKPQSGQEFNNFPYPDAKPGFSWKAPEKSE